MTWEIFHLIIFLLYTRIYLIKSFKWAAESRERGKIYTMLHKDTIKWDDSYQSPIFQHITNHKHTSKIYGKAKIERRKNNQLIFNLTFLQVVLGEPCLYSTEPVTKPLFWSWKHCSYCCQISPLYTRESY